MKKIKSKLIQEVRAYIEKEHLPQPPMRLIVALSGGADSVGLLVVLKLLEYECVAVHCNFHLRGAESDRDQQFVENLCKHLNVPLRLTHFDTKKYASVNGISIEMAARDLRYAWFEEVRKAENAEYIAVAHHADDSIETFLMNMLRGTGIKGLTGIKPLQGRIFRPLLCVYKNHIEQYLDSIGQTFVTDSTNSDQSILRNKFRHTVIPLLQEMNPAAKDNLLKDINHLHDAEIVYDEYIASTQNKLTLKTTKKFQIDIRKLQKLKTRKTMVYEMLKPYGFNAATAQDIVKEIENPETGKVFLSADYEAIINRYSIAINRKYEPDTKQYVITEDVTSITEPFLVKIQDIERSKLKIIGMPQYAYFDKSKLKFPLTIRLWQDGDKFVPFGMIGQKKVSDYLTDKKYSKFKKNTTYVLIDNTGTIVWVIDERIDNRFRLDANTKSCKVFEVRKRNSKE